jgi:hypothetical protein
VPSGPIRRLILAQPKSAFSAPPRAQPPSLPDPSRTRLHPPPCAAWRERGGAGCTLTAAARHTSALRLPAALVDRALLYPRAMVLHGWRGTSERGRVRGAVSRVIYYTAAAADARCGVSGNQAPMHSLGGWWKGLARIRRRKERKTPPRNQGSQWWDSWRDSWLSMCSDEDDEFQG